MGSIISILVQNNKVDSEPVSNLQYQKMVEVID